MVKATYTFAVIEETHELVSGQTIMDFRHEPHVFQSVLRLPEPGRSGLIETDQGTFYHQVFPGIRFEED